MFVAEHVSSEYIKMKQIEQNIMNSFRMAKSDIIKLQSDVIELREELDGIIEKLAKVESKPAKRVVKIIKTKAPRQKAAHKAQHYVASKESKKFHKPHCPFAQNILPKMKLRFKSTITARNKGFKPCKCVK